MDCSNCKFFKLYDTPYKVMKIEIKDVGCCRNKEAEPVFINDDDIYPFKIRKKNLKFCAGYKEEGACKK